MGVAAFFIDSLPAAHQLDNLMLDAFARLVQAPGDPGGAVLACVDEPALVEEGDWPWRPERLAEMLATVARARPTLIGVAPNLTAVLLSASPASLAAVRDACARIPLVLSFRPAPELPESLTHRVKRAALLDADWGVWEHGTDRDGFVRFLQLDSAEGESFELRVAQRLASAGGPPDSAAPSASAALEHRPETRDRRPAPQGFAAPPGPRSSQPPLRIRFTGPARSLPYVSLLRLAKGELPAGTVTGRPVLVGLTAGSAMRAFPTPTTAPDRPMPDAEVAVHALHSLQADRPLTEAGTRFRIAVQIAMGLVFFNLCRWFSVVSSYLLLAFTIVATVSLSLLLFLYKGLVLPVTPLLALDFGLFALVLRFKLAEHDRRLRGVLLKVTGNSPGPEAGNTHSWKEALVALGQYVECEVSALVHLPHAGGEAVLEASFGLSVDQEALLVRSIPNTPGGEDQPSALRGALDGKDVCAVPLRFGNRTRGYWLFTPTAEIAPLLTGTRARTLSALAGELSRREFERELLQGGARGARTSVTETVFEDPRDRELDDLDNLTDEASRDRLFLRDVLERLEVGILTSSLLGEVSYVNAAFARVLGQPAAEIARANFFDSVGRLLQPSGQDLRQTLDHVLTTARVTHLEYAPNHSKSIYFVTWSTVHHETPAGPGAAAGFLCTALDVSRHRALDHLKTHMLDALTLKVRNVLSIVVGYSEEFMTFDGGVEDAVETGRIVHGTALQLSELFEDFQSVSQFGLTSDRLKRVPVDPLHSAQAAVDASIDFAQSKGCAFSVNASIPPEPVRGDPVFLGRSIQALIYQSLLNSPSGGKVEIDFEHQPGRLVIRIASHGYGLPGEAVARYFDEPEEWAEPVSAWQTAGQLLPHQVRRALTDMEGGVELESRVGEGTTFRIWLPLL